MWRFLLVSFCLASVSLGCFSCSGGYTIIESKCGRCHKSEIVYGKKRDLSEWERILYAMKLRGLAISENEKEEVLKVLNEKKLITY